MTLRNELNEIFLERGALKKFCERHDLDYNYVLRVKIGRIKKPSLENGLKICNAIAAELGQQRTSDVCS